MPFELRYRDALPTVVADELDALIAKIRAFVLVEHNEDGTHRPAAAATNFVPVGSGALWFTTTPPTGWLICDGSAISRVTYRDLFLVMGTQFGGGNGTTTFNLPDFRGRFPIGKAASGTASALGQSGGSLNHTHTLSGATASDGAHDHAISGSTAAGGDEDTSQPFNGDAVAQAGSDIEVSTVLHQHSGPSHTHAAGTLAADSDGAHTHGVGTLATAAANPPFLAVNYIVKY